MGFLPPLEAALYNRQQRTQCHLASPPPRFAETAKYTRLPTPRNRTIAAPTASGPVSLPLVYATIDGLDYDAISAMLKVPVGTVKTQVFRGKQLLREKLQAIYESRRYPA
ncbi:MAG: sigma factor-like helix-turn-helix DNA-binding protein [Steroidobacteraceae bacterium]